MRFFFCSVNDVAGDAFGRSHLFGSQRAGLLMAVDVRWEYWVLLRASPHYYLH